GFCREGGGGGKTIKSTARVRGEGPGQRRFSCYEPLTDPGAITRAVQFVLGRPGLFLNSSSDATLLRHILDAAAQPAHLPPVAALADDVSRWAIQPLFVRGVAEGL